MIPLAPKSTGRLQQKQPTKILPWEQEQGRSKLAKLGPGNQTRRVHWWCLRKNPVSMVDFSLQGNVFPPNKEKRFLTSWNKLACTSATCPLRCSIPAFHSLDLQQHYSNTPQELWDRGGLVPILQTQKITVATGGQSCMNVDTSGL